MDPRCRFLSFALLLLLVACSGDDPGIADPVEATPEVTPEATPEVTPEAPPEEPITEAEPTPEPTPAGGLLEGEPHVIPEVVSMPGMADRFTFWGWSADGLRYAFEIYRAGEGAIECDMKYEVFVVDAETDRFVQDGKLVVAHESPEPGPSGVCVPRELEPLLEEQRAALFETHGIVAGNLSPPVEVKDRGGSYSFETPAGKAVPLVFRILHEPPESMGPEAEAGAAYYLALSPSEGKLVVEAGRTRRPYVLSYKPKLVFFSPAGRHAAMVVGRTHTAFEGTRDSWMTNGVALPDYL